MTEYPYTCFLHPQRQGASLEEPCPDCGEKFGFPLENPPETINGRPVQSKGLSRGFYGAVFETLNPRTNRKYAVKVIPAAIYAPKSDGGYGKDFEEEASLHAELSSVGLIARLEDRSAQPETLQFGRHAISCYWLEMEYVKGPTLREKIQNGPEDPREIAQIAWDLLDFIDALQQLHRYHNDLHGGNVKIVSYKESEARRQAIHPGIGVRILDLGSAADKTKSNGQRLGDVHRVAEHILALLNSYERKHEMLDPWSLRVCAQLRRVAEYYCGVDRQRPPTPADMKSAILAAYGHGERPWTQPVRLASVAEHYNAQTLPSWFAPSLFYDPDGRWAQRLTAPGPQLLAGMRGCGKTILLRSLEWVARIHPRSGERQEAVVRRVESDRFLGLFVSCAALLQSPRATSIHLPLHRLFLAFAREVIRNVHVCELTRIGRIDYNALRPFADIVKRIVPWFDQPANAVDVVALERSLSKAVQDPPLVGNSTPEVSPRLAFDELAAHARRLVDLWDGKVLLFLLDDVSTRYLPATNVDQLLSQLSLQSPDFGFKISTETQTLQLTTPGGEPARSGRDYEIFDLGADVLAQLSGSRGTEFIEEVLQRRSAITNAAPAVRPSGVLGRQTLVDIATAIRERPSKSPVYWGLDALGGICVGDIGDVLQIYALILQRHGATSAPVPKETQHKAMIDFAEQKLFALAGRDEWLYYHAAAFAEAAHRELKNSNPRRLRQYNEIFVKIEEADAEALFPRIIKLIDAGLFVFTGGTPRTKTQRAAPFLLFKLAYRKVLGLTHRIPISMRDRFELSGDRLAAWLERPSGVMLELDIKRKAKRRRKKGEPPAREVRTSGAGRAETGDVSQYVLFAPAAAAPSPIGEDQGWLPGPRALHRVKTVAAGYLSSVEVDWDDKHVIAALGFETRSVGAWENLLPVGRPAAVTMLQYRDLGLAAQIIDTLRRAGLPYNTVPTKSVPTLSQAKTVVESCGSHGVVVDTTSLTKSLIYMLVAEALRVRNEVWVLHTSAEEYFPPEQDLVRAIELFQAGKLPEAFRALDEAVVSESGPYSSLPVGPQYRDPSQPSMMAAFISLKHQRIQHLLEEAPVEAIAAISPVHSAGRDAVRSVAARYVADYLVHRYGGNVYEVGALDHEGTYDRLVELHARYALDCGYNFEIGLTGTKMNAVGAAMLAGIALPASVYYSAPDHFDPNRFTRGSGTTRVIHLRRIAIENA